MQLVIDLVQLISHSSLRLREIQHQYLLSLISQSEIARPRRKRINPRVVKIKMSKFKRKSSSQYQKVQYLPEFCSFTTYCSQYPSRDDLNGCEEAKLISNKEQSSVND